MFSLNGKARGVLNSLPFDCTYEKTKVALLRRFNLTHNEYTKKFFLASPNRDENIIGYSHRLGNYFDMWISLSNTKKDYENLKYVLIRHIIISSCNSKLGEFLLEREPNSIEALQKESEKYLNAHGGETICEEIIFHM